MAVRALLAVAGLLAATLPPVRSSPEDPQSRSMMPRGIITADMFKNNRQDGARKLALPPAVQGGGGQPISEKGGGKHTAVGVGKSVLDTPTDRPSTLQQNFHDTNTIEELIKKNHPQFYYQNFYDPSRSGATDQLMTSSNAINSVNQMKSMAASANSLQQSPNQLPSSLAQLRSSQQASLQAGLGGLDPAEYGGGNGAFGESTFSGDAAAVAALYGLQQKQDQMMSSSFDQQYMNYNDLTYNPLRKSYNLQHQQHRHLLSQPPYTTNPPAVQSFIGSVFMPFKTMGKSIVDAVEPLVSSSNHHHQAIPNPFQLASEKLDLSKLGFGENTLATSYGQPAVVSSYGAPTPTLYGGDSGVSGISAINSDSLPFFAGAAAIAAIGAFCLSVAATGANVTLGKREAEYSIVKEVSQQLLDVLEDQYHSTIDQGFQQLSGALQQPCVGRLLCKGASHVFDDSTIDDMNYRMDQAFDLLKQGKEVRDELHEVLDSAENEECGHLPCWGGGWETFI